MTVAFNVPRLVGPELEYLAEALANRHLSGGGPFTQRCERWLADRLGVARVLLTHSCTAALEMAALLAGLEPGDEVIMPSFTFVSTANAVVLRGAVPVFVDIRPDTLNLDEALIEAAITPRTRAICVVHYAGVACEMDAIMAIAARHGLLVIEDAAQALGATFRDRPLGGIGHMAALSFHETKNVMSGEGGALILRDPALVERAEILWQKGTDRLRFDRGEVSKYTWVDVGSSFLPSEIIAAVLWAQLGAMEAITAHRLALWDAYAEALAPLERDGLLCGPRPPAAHRHNAHIHHVLLNDAARRAEVLADLRRAGVHAVSHYVPLHDSPAGRRFARSAGPMRRTEDIAARLVRLPLHGDMTREDVANVVRTLAAAVRPDAVAEA
ncbi:MAG: dTDP-4-amino-4,6-dideoxygalactose transaminase [Rhodospirillales bacterium]|jgi:dTDP-4-amino-4,6-dideoxygalactose transaminase